MFITFLSYHLFKVQFILYTTRLACRFTIRNYFSMSEPTGIADRKIKIFLWVPYRKSISNGSFM